MDCPGIRDVAYEYLRGWCEPGISRDIDAHLSGCPSCAAEMRDAQLNLVLLKALPEIEASPRTWNAIAAQLPSPRRAGMRFWIRAAAAASIGVALVSFVVLWGATRAASFPAVDEAGNALTWHESYRADRFTTLRLPDVGLLKLNRGTSLRFVDPRTVILESGEVFAAVTPSGKGFEIRTGETAVRVHGTSFGVAAPSTVYVLEGRVEVRSPRGRVELGANQVAVEAALAPVTADAYLHWVTRHDRPTVRLKLDPRDRTTITPGASLQWRLTLETDALAPLYLEDLRDASQFLSLNIDGQWISLDPNSVRVQGARVSNGRIRLDVSHPCVLDCAIDPGVFRKRGRSDVRAVFTSGTASAPEIWAGIAQSDPVTVEVR